jgi:pyruvate dehydrogenase E2 component (dihydrolipoamide acetyltransferase)
MTFSVTMPALGESVSEGTVTRWLKAEGDHVAMDEPLLEVSTDKVDTEIPSPVAGTLQKIVVGIDQTVPVGAELAIIADGAAPAASPAPAAPIVAAPVAVAPVTPPTAAPVAAPVATPSASSAGTIITMPALGESVSEGTVTRWLKGVGDSVAVDEALLEVSTDKVDTEIPSPVAGTIIAIDVPVDTTVPVGARLAVIGGAGATSAPAPVVAAPVAAAPVAAPVVAAPVVVAPVATPAPPAAPIAAPVAVSQPLDAYVTPIVRKLASELGVNLASITGTGVGGRIRKEDVQAAAPKVSSPVAAPITSAPAAATTQRSAAPVAASPLRGTTVTMSRLRKVIAARMVESLQVSAQLTTVIEVDVTKIARLRDRSKATFEAREGVKLSFLPFFAVAVCEALKQHPVSYTHLTLPTSP